MIVVEAPAQHRERKGEKREGKGNKERQMSPPGPAASIHTPHHSSSCNAAYNTVSAVNSASCDGIVPVRWLLSRFLHSIEKGEGREKRGKRKQGETNESTGPCSHHPHPAPLLIMQCGLQ
jgi:hypothetical protein